MLATSRHHGKRSIKLVCRYSSTNVNIPKSASEDIGSLRASLRGTVPEHQSLLLLHTRTPPAEWPSDPSRVVPLMKQVLAVSKRFHGKVLLCYPSSPNIRGQSMSLPKPYESPDQAQDFGQYPATFCTKLVEPFNTVGLTSQHLERLTKFFVKRAQNGVDVASLLIPPNPYESLKPDSVYEPDPSTSSTQNFQARSVMRSMMRSSELGRHHAMKKTWILVCTHGSRDCRCGDKGKNIASLIRGYIRERKLTERVIVGEVSHVGGHKYAPNVLVYPYGEWYGTLEPSQVESFMDSLLGVESDDSLSGPQSPLWRGSWFDHSGTPTSAADVDQYEKTQAELEEWGTDLEALGQETLEVER